jgi:type II secretion system protein D
MRTLRILPLLLLALPATAQDEQPPVQPPIPGAENQGQEPQEPVQPPLPPGIPIPGQPPQPQPQPPVPAGPVRPPIAPADAPGGAPQPGIPLEDNLIVEDIIEPKLSGNALAGLYRKYTGRRVIVTAAAQTAEFSFVQEASPEDPITWGDAARYLRIAATLENFIFVPDAFDPNLDILTLATGGTGPRPRGLEIYTENDILPAGDAVISYVMSFQHIKPEQAVSIFQSVIGQFGAFGSIAPVANAAAIIITENTSLIRRLITLKDEIDKPSTLVGTRFITVQHADVTELAATINDLLSGQQQAQRSAGIQRAGTPAAEGAPAIEGAPPAAPGQPDQPGATSSGEDTPVQIIPDQRTNRIFAMGRPVDLIFVEGLIREFDTESDQRNFLRRKLRFLPVSDFLPIAGDALARAFTGTGDAGGVTGGGGGQAGSTRGARATGGGGAGAATQQFGGAQPGTFGGGTGGRGGAAARGDVLSDPQTSAAPQSLLVGRTLLVADNITNSIVVQGPPSGVEIIENLLDQVDVRADQVMISTVFGQLSLGDTTSTGVNWLRAFREFNGTEGGAAGSIISGGAPSNRLPDSMINPIIDPITGLPNSVGLSLYGRIGSSVATYINLLQSNSDFTILSRPSIFTANNQRGTISSGRRIAIPTSSNQFGAGGVSTNIEYRDVVLRLEVVPLVNSPEEVTLTIALVNDEVIGESPPIGDIGSVPIIGTSELITTITVPNNQTVVLGGLITTSDNETMTGIPILSNIPGLGRLFSTKTRGLDRSELMIFIQPSIISGPQSLDAIQVDMDSRFNVSDDIRRMADGPGVLPPVDLIPIPEKGAAPAAVIAPVPVAPSPAAASPGSRINRRPIHRR